MKFFLTGVLTMITCMFIHATDAGGGLIFYGDAKVAGRENVFAYPDSSLNVTNNVTKTTQIKKKKETPKFETHTENKIVKQQAPTTVLHDFPFTPASSSYFTASRESATIVQQRTDEYLPAGKTACREKTYSYIKNSDLSIYHPEPRQKLSIAATQFGMLTSFGSNYPPFFLKPASAIKLSSRALRRIPEIIFYFNNLF